MKTIHALLLFYLLAATSALAAEAYQCTLIKDAGKDGYRQDAKQQVELSIDGDKVSQIIRINAANKNLKFKTCALVGKDGSNFSRWFETECKELSSADGTPYTSESYLLDAYAGISPVITADYILYKEIAAASKSAGIAMPERTFAIYANRKPIYEFFCLRR